MFARTRYEKRHRLSSQTVTTLILLLAGLWVFVGTIDGPSVRFESRYGYDVYKTAKPVDASHSAQAWPLWIAVFSEPPLPVHASFLLFDFKQNLRHWPNVAGDISRSPPFSLPL